MKLIQYINAFVAFVKKHALSAFIGLCLAVLFIGCIAYLFHDHHALFGVVALVFLCNPCHSIWRGLHCQDDRKQPIKGITHETN